MRHRQIGRRLDMDGALRRAMFRNMATSLMLHGQVRTTVPRAKELRRFAERLITLGKRAPSQAALAALSGDELTAAKADRVAAYRRVAAFLMNDDAVARVMTEYADRFRTRPGGYTRIVKLSRRRPGDNAAMAVIQLVEAYEPVAATEGESASAAE
ncbi:MAG: 50S ribosomal protein L17 [Alphaproteobacteria bacterium]|nr:50S ribosomal protein L17 [Alphaproteobacteria bacterium]MCB9696143.1 50S ribosomal protein L17 [Alphaproteobacteria bacterium]